MDLQSVIFKKLKTIAERKSHGIHKHAAAIVYNGRIISVGWNKKKSHPIQKKFGRNQDSIYLHAEIDAIIKGVRKYDTDYLRDCDLYVLRFTRRKQLGNSKPCEGCQKAIDFFGIRNVYHT